MGIATCALLLASVALAKESETERRVHAVMSAVDAHLTTARLEPGDFSVSQDGARIAYAVERSGVRELRVRVAGSSDEGVLIAENALWPLWSPDGTKLAFLQMEGGIQRLAIWDRATGEPQRVPASEVVARGSARSKPQWSADSKRIAFIGAPFRRDSQQSVDVHGRARPGWIGLRAHGVTLSTGSASEVAENDSGRDHPDVPYYRIYGYQQLAVYDSQEKSLRWFQLPEHRRIVNFNFDPGGRRIALAVSLSSKDIPRNEAAQARASVYVVRVDEDLQAQLAVATANPDVEGSTSRLDTLRPPLLSLVEYALNSTVGWSPDGRHLTVVTGGAVASNDIVLYDAASGEPSCLTCTFTAVAELARVPVAQRDGTFLLKAINGSHASSAWLRWLPEGPTVVRNDGAELWQVYANGRPPRLLFKHEDVVIDEVLGSAREAEAFVLNGKEIVASFRRRSNGMMGYLAIGIDSGRFRIIAEYAKKLPVSILDRQLIERRNELYFVAEDPENPRDLFGLDLERGTTARVLKLNSAKQPPTVLRLEWPTAGGATTHGNLFLPVTASRTRKLPLVMIVYPDRKRPSQIREFDFSAAQHGLARLLVDLGFGVFEPHIPIEKFGAPMEQIAENTKRALTAAIASGRIDPDRVGVYGHSFGGYAVNTLITQTRLFKAAVAAAGISDLVALYAGGNDDAQQVKLPKPLWKHTGAWVENSPIMYLPNVETPLLLLHGREDATCPFAQAQFMYRGLKALDKPVMLVSYPGEGHNLWNQRYIRHYLTVSALFFDQYLFARRTQAELDPSPTVAFAGP